MKAYVTEKSNKNLPFGVLAQNNLKVELDVNLTESSVWISLYDRSLNKRDKSKTLTIPLNESSPLLSTPYCSVIWVTNMSGATQKSLEVCREGVKHSHTLGKNSQKA